MAHYAPTDPQSWPTSSALQAATPINQNPGAYYSAFGPPFPSAFLDQAPHPLSFEHFYFQQQAPWRYAAPPPSFSPNINQYSTGDYGFSTPTLSSSSGAASAAAPMPPRSNYQNALNQINGDSTSRLAAFFGQQPPPPPGTSPPPPSPPPPPPPPAHLNSYITSTSNDIAALTTSTAANFPLLNAFVSAGALSNPLNPLCFTQKAANSVLNKQNTPKKKMQKATSATAATAASTLPSSSSQPAAKRRRFMLPHETMKRSTFVTFC